MKKSNRALSNSDIAAIKKLVATDRAEGDTPAKAADPIATNYKPSRFNAHATAVDGSLILYNAFTGHRCAVPASSVPALSPYLSQRGIQGPLTPLGEYLERKGYIVDQSRDEEAMCGVRYGLQQFRSDVLQLILLASEDCNFRCIYCSQQFKAGTMVPDVREGVRNMVKRHLGRLSHLEVSWFGGEPMLGYAAIEELAPFFQDAAASRGIAYRSDITTNGYLLTPERSRKMVSWGIQDYQITLDGAEADHDAYRPLQNGEPTFWTIVENITAMKALREPFSVCIRVNFDRSSNHQIERLMKILEVRFGGDRRFWMRFRRVGKWGHPNDANLNTCDVNEASRVERRLIMEAKSHALATEGVSWVNSENLVCYAARPYNFVIGASGKVMKCTVLLDRDPTNVVGNISPDGSLNLHEGVFAKWVQPFCLTDPICRKCFFVPRCQAAECPRSRVLTGVRACPPLRFSLREDLMSLRRDRLGGTTVRLRGADYVQGPE